MRAALVVVALLMAVPVAADYSAAARSDFARGQAAMATRDWDTAMRHLTAAVQAEPGFWEAHKALGECLLRLNKPTEARKHLEEASRLSPSDTGVQDTLRRAIELEKAHAEDDAMAEKIRQQLRSKSSPVPGKTATPVGDLAAMRQRAASIFRPRMAAVAAAAKAYRSAARRYLEASCRYRPGAFEVGRYNSEADWIRRMRGDAASENDATPDCRAIAGEMRALGPRIAAAMDGADAQLASPPPVSRPIREEVFGKLVQELW
jgi:tetratricopeptide (TPR) repeat protein